MPKKAAKPNGRESPTSTSELEFRAFDRSLPMLLMKARESVMQRFRPHLRRHDITEQQWRILRVLAEDKNVDMMALASRCSIQPPSLSRTIPLLVERGIVRRGSHGNDQRRILVDLTPKGRLLFKTMSTESAKIYARMEADIGDSHLINIYKVLDQLIATAESRDDVVEAE